MKRYTTIFYSLLFLLSISQVKADCTSGSGLGDTTLGSIGFTYSATGDPCANLATASYTGNLDVNMASGAVLTMHSIVINGDFILTNQGTQSTFYVPAGVTVTITGDLGDPSNNNFVFLIDGTLVVDGTISGKNQNAFQGSGSVDAGGLDFNQAPTCDPGNCPSITADTCSPEGTSFCDNALPIVLGKFEAISKMNSIEINWTTFSEINNDYFTIEQSKDGVNYNSIATMAGAGNSATILKYTYIDKNPVLGRSYYRLKQTDYDGTSETFAPVAVDFSTLADGNLSFNNPVKPGDNVSIFTNADDSEELNVAVFSMIGEAIISEKFTGAQYQFDLNSNVKPGVYFVKISSVKSQQTGRLVVQ